MRLWTSVLALCLAVSACAGPGNQDPRSQDPRPNASGPVAQPGSVMSHIVNATVQLKAERGDKKRSGSAVVFWRDADSGKTLMLTAAHLFTPVVEQNVYAIDPLTRQRRPAEVVAIDEDRDLAIVSSSMAAAQVVVMRPITRLGDEVWVAAFPWGRKRTVVSGFVSQIRWSSDELHDEVPIEGPVNLIDASVSYGMSGGGVFDKTTGALVGLVRGYRTAELSYGGGNSKPLRFPVAGETTVVPIADIICFLARKAEDHPPLLTHANHDSLCPA